MHGYWALRPFLCLLLTAFLVYCWLDRKNGLQKLRLELPALQEEIVELQREESRIRYEIDAFEHPSHLTRLLQEPRYAHLVYPKLPEVLFLTASEAPSP
ncbi:MAG: hypothetical protein ACOYKZ_08195 [Chlamydiia bacterium]